MRTLSLAKGGRCYVFRYPSGREEAIIDAISQLAEDDRTVARATDMELGLTVELEAETEGEGALLLPGRLLTDVMRSLPAGKVLATLGLIQPVSFNMR